VPQIKRQALFIERLFRFGKSGVAPITGNKGFPVHPRDEPKRDKAK